jgi:hypothetical protein
MTRANTIYRRLTVTLIATFATLAGLAIALDLSTRALII